MLRIAKKEGLIAQDATSFGKAGETNNEGELVHKACRDVSEFLYSFETSSKTTELRMAGYKEGKPFEAYLNYGYGAETPSLNSYRILKTAYSAMMSFRLIWTLGYIIPGCKIACESVYGPSNPGEPENLIGFQYKMEDVNSKTNHLLANCERIAQATLSYALIMWKAAHIGGKTFDEQKRVQVYLDTDKYEGDMKGEFKYFNDKRNEAIAHPYNSEWDSLNTNRPYTPYPEWARDWRRLEELLSHSAFLCQQDFNAQMGLEPPTEGFMDLGGSMDTLQTVSNFIEAFDMPADLRQELEETPPPTPTWYTLPKPFGL